MTEGEFLSFIAVSESTPGPLAINMATFIGASQGGFLGLCDAGCGAAVLVIPCVVAMILATAVNMALSTLAGFAADKAGIAPDLRSIVVFLLLWGCMPFAAGKGKAPSPIGMILLSAALGILFWENKNNAPGGSR